MFMFPELRILGEYYEMGGFVMLPLIVVAVLLWYALIFRWLNVKTGRRDPRNLIARAEQGKFSRHDYVTARAAAIAVAEAKQPHTKRQLKSLLNERFGQIKKDINQHRSMVRALVAVAPLLGLLGTVDGMIETFNSLGDMALFSRSGGIAGGISRALFTTQMGLAISIPGLMIGRMVERKQMNINRELDQIRDLVCANYKD